MTDNREKSIRDYWDRKLVRWDQEVYDQRTGIVPRLRKSVEARMLTALEILKPHLPETTVLDLGCGTGRMAMECVKAGSQNAHGIDISPHAVEQGNELVKRLNLTNQVSLVAGNIFQTPWPESDIILALGVLDWLNDQETDQLVSRLKDKKFVISYSEQDGSAAEILHRFYLVYPLLLQGKNVRARHHTRNEIEAVLNKHGIKNRAYVKTKAARFGVLVHNLD